LITPTIGCPDLVIRHQCVAEHQPEWGRSWLNVRGDQKYKAELNCEEQTQLNAVRRARLRKRKRLPGPSPNAPVKKAARRIKQPVAPAVETVAAEVIEQPVAVTDEASTGPAVCLVSVSRPRRPAAQVLKEGPRHPLQCRGRSLRLGRLTPRASG